MVDNEDGKVVDPGQFQDVGPEPPAYITESMGQYEKGADYLVFERGADVEIEKVKWFWPGRIPLGMVTLLDGMPGMAKSTIALTLAACATSGAAMPDGKRGAKGPVIYVSYEDGHGITLLPRFRAAGGNPKDFYMGETIQTDAGERSLAIPEDVDKLEALLVKVGAVMVVIDPLMAALGKVKTGLDNEVRSALLPVSRMAERTGCTVLLIRHLNKAINVTDPVLRGGGSIGIIAAARAGLIVARDPDDPDVRVLAVTKNNLGRDDAPALTYRVDTDVRYDVGRITWLGASGKRAHDLLRDESTPASHRARGEAVGIIQELLKDGPVLATEAKAYCREAGVRSSTMDRAKAKLAVFCEPRKGEDGKMHWWWSLPEGKGGRA